jgi:hypothetical protein
MPCPVLSLDPGSSIRLSWGSCGPLKLYRPAPCAHPSLDPLLDPSIGVAVSFSPLELYGLFSSSFLYP